MRYVPINPFVLSVLLKLHDYGCVIDLVLFVLCPLNSILSNSIIIVAPLVLGPGGFVGKSFIAQSLNFVCVEWQYMLFVLGKTVNLQLNLISQFHDLLLVPICNQSILVYPSSENVIIYYRKVQIVQSWNL